MRRHFHPCIWTSSPIWTNASTSKARPSTGSCNAAGSLLSVTFYRMSDGTLIAREDDETERPATMRECLDYDLDPARWSEGDK
jgi:hypothetical protein